MKNQLTTGIRSMLTTISRGGACHVAKAAEFHALMMATGKRSLLQRFGLRRDDWIGGDGRHRRSEQYRLQPVLRLG